MKKNILLALCCMALLGTVSVPVANAGPEGRCRACHDFGEKNKTGPALKGIMGRKAGTYPGFKYSDSLKNGGWTWNEENMRKWIYDSKAAIKELTGNPCAKTKMAKQKVKGAKADKIIAFLKGL